MSEFMYIELPKRCAVITYSPKTLLIIDEYRKLIHKESFSDKIYKRFFAVDKLDIHVQLPLYFDHTVASADSSYPRIYLQGVIPGDTNYGKLMKYCPDKEVGTRVYEKYFKGLLPKPIVNTRLCE